MHNSDYLLMEKSGDSATYSRLENYRASGNIMRKEVLRYASLPCLPLDKNMYDDDFYRVESTGAIVTLSSSVGLIYFYCSQLPSDGYFNPTPRRDINKEMGICTLYLPKSCPLQTIVAHGNLKSLKQTACLEACKQRHQIGALTDNVVPDIAVVKAEAQKIGNEPYNDEQPIYFPPELVNQCPHGTKTTSYYYLIELKMNFCYDIPVHDIVLATRTELESDIANLNFDLEVDRGRLAVNLKYVGDFQLTLEQVLLCRRFQITLFSVLMGCSMDKLMEILGGFRLGNKLEMDYLLLPSNNLNGQLIDWKSFTSVLLSCNNVFKSHMNCSMNGNGRVVQTKSGLLCPCMIHNSLVYTPHNNQIYCVTGILEHLNANSLLRRRRGRDITYKKYYEDQHGIKLCFDQESLLHGRHIFRAQNYLSKCRQQKEKESSNISVELPPELCRVIMSPISLSTFYSFTFVPSIMHRLQSLLLAVNLKKMLLDRCMQNVDIPTIKGFIHTESFDPKSWMIPGDNSGSYALNEDSLSNSRKIYILGKNKVESKTVKDAAEALIGAFLSTGGENAGLLFLNWIGIKVDFVNVPYDRHFQVLSERLVKVRHLESLLNYSFRDPSLLVEALTHGSYMVPEIPRCYQRLEFLGDAVLDYLITVHLFNKYPNLSPGVLTDMRSASVNNDCYAQSSVKHGLHKHILHASQELHKQIFITVNSFEKLSLKSTFGWESESSFPKVLGDIIESLAGAIFVDSGCNKEIVFQSIRPLLEPLITPGTMKFHPTRELNEFCQKQHFDMKKPVNLRVNGKSSVTIEVEANGRLFKHTTVASDKETAKKVACKEVLKSLKESTCRR